MSATSAELSAPRPAVYPCHVFKQSVSIKATVNISKTDVIIIDPTDGSVITFDSGGSDLYFIDIIIVGTKKAKRQNIIIYRKMPLCPISGLPIIEPEMASKALPSINYAMQPELGFAYNGYQVQFTQHLKFELNPIYYFNITRINDVYVYLVVPIVDGRHMPASIVDTLYEKLGNMDIVEKIASYYNHHAEAHDKNFNFYMANTPIKPKTLYHKHALLELLHKNALKIGICCTDLIGCIKHYNGNILMLEPTAYDYVSPYGTQSPLKGMFSSRKRMMEFRNIVFEELQKFLGSAT
jgi:hypothetical protein